MREHTVPIGRRGFLKAGASSSILIAALPLWRHSAPDHPYQSGFHPGDPDSRNQRDELEKLVLKYGGEFGEVGKEQ